jgi:hypothetical protein
MVFCKSPSQTIGKQVHTVFIFTESTLAVLNSIDCEAHRELILAFLKKNKEQ